MRRFIAFVILPFVAALLAYLAFPLFAQSLTRQIGGSFSSDAAISFSAGVFIVAAFVTLIAVPIVSAMSRRGPVTFARAVVAGVLLGNAPFLIVSAVILIGYVFAGAPNSPSTMSYGATGAFRTIAMGTFLGAALGSVFWLVGVRELRART